MKKLKKRLLVFLLSMAMCCPLLLNPMTVFADGEGSIDTPIEGFDPNGISAVFQHSCAFENKIEINFDTQGTKTLLLTHAKLEKC